MVSPVVWRGWACSSSPEHRRSLPGSSEISPPNIAGPSPVHRSEAHFLPHPSKAQAGGRSSGKPARAGERRAAFGRGLGHSRSRARRLSRMRTTPLPSHFARYAGVPASGSAGRRVGPGQRGRGASRFPPPQRPTFWYFRPWRRMPPPPAGERLWHHITQADEDRALAALRRYRNDDPEKFRYRPRLTLASAAEGFS